jgi:hypothetical protein
MPNQFLQSTIELTPFSINRQFIITKSSDRIREFVMNYSFWRTELRTFPLTKKSFCKGIGL